MNRLLENAVPHKLLVLFGLSALAYVIQDRAAVGWAFLAGMQACVVADAISAASGRRLPYAFVALFGHKRQWHHCSGCGEMWPCTAILDLAVKLR